MSQILRRTFLASILGVVGFALLPAHAAAAGEKQPAHFAFKVSFAKEALAEHFTGRVVVFTDRSARGNPMDGPNWFAPEPMFAADFKDIAPGDSMVIDASNWISFPHDSSAITKGEYRIQAVIDRNLGGRSIGDTPGNLYSEPKKVALDPADASKPIEIVCDKTIARRPFKDNDRVKELRVESKLLSDFYGRKTTINGAVCLPEEWAKEPNRKFPVYYSVPGFGGTHEGAARSKNPPGTKRAGEPFINVALDPSCPGGHSVFADSANNGPWGKALTEEFIPACESRFRGIGKPEARFVGGHSSGGWSSLWLQVAYPDVFGGCWSTSPDPVDFRDFQRIDIYADGENMFVDHDGHDRPLARQGDQVLVLYRAFSDMERPLRGEQLGSFEEVFSPRGKDGKSLKLWNRDTGAIDKAVAEAWKPYDIGLTLRTHWTDLAPKLAGKIHVYMGTEDTFYLEGAVKLLKHDLEAIKADAVVELVPGDHGTMMTRELRERIDTEMAAQFKKHAEQGR